mgnify:CR=1 FL=1
MMKEALEMSLTGEGLRVMEKKRRGDGYNASGMGGTYGHFVVKSGMGSTGDSVLLVPSGPLRATSQFGAN